MSQGYVTIDHNGTFGLANQIFLYAVGYATAKKYNKCFILPFLERRGTRPTYWQNFFSYIKENYVQDPFPVINWTPYKEEESNYYKYIEIPNYPNLYLRGYFQSLDYLEPYREEIRNTLFQWPYWQEKVKAMFPLSLEDTCAIHFRLGDYKKEGHRQHHGICPLEYYRNALSLIQSKTSIERYLIFCEKEDQTEVKMKIDSLELKNAIMICDYDYPEYIELVLISLCSHVVMANSSFSLIGAYFNDNSNKIVCYPYYWLGDRTKNIEIGLPEWHRIKYTVT